MNRYVFLIAGLLLLIISDRILAWYEKSHSYLVKLAVEIVQEHDEDGRLYEELYADDFVLQLGRGAWREDFDPPVVGASRAMRHYYDPDARTQDRNRPTCGIKYQAYFRLWPYFDPGAETAPPKNGFYDGALPWAQNGSGEPGNSFTWEKAIQIRGHNTSAAREEAYYRLGHVLHLLGDMSEPDHATNTVHPGSGKYLPDNVEEILVAPASRLLRLVTDPLDLQTEEKRRVAEESVRLAIHAYVKRRMAETYGSGRIRLTGLEGLVEDSIDPPQVADFFDAVERGVLPPRLPSLPPPSLDGRGVVAKPSLEAYFDDLARFAKQQQRDAQRKRPEMRLALGCEDVLPYMRQFLEETFGRDSRITRAMLNSSYFAEPIYALPTINEFDSSNFGPYLDLSNALMREATGYIAGLMMHYHDIVNEPPYVMELTVEQTRERYYWGGWQDGETIETPTGRSREDYYTVSCPDEFVPKKYPMMNGRRWVDKTDRFLFSGGPATVKIVFGPVFTVGDVEITERIDATSVKVLVDGEELKGGMTDSNIWVGEYVPRLKPGEDERLFQVRIEAADLHHHFPRPGFPETGYRLDAQPVTIAAPRGDRPNYPWESYTPGPDECHRFRVVQNEEFALGNRIVTPSEMILAVSGRPDPERIKAERKRWNGHLQSETPAVTAIVLADGKAEIRPSKLELQWESRAGELNGWREAWTAEFQPGKGDIESADGACWIASVRSEWREEDGQIKMFTTRREPKESKWNVRHVKDGTYRLDLSAWAPPSFLLDRVQPPARPEVLVAQYIAWFNKGCPPEHLERIEKELVRQDRDPLTAVASLCAARKDVFLRKTPNSSDKEFSDRLTSLALRHLSSSGPYNENRGEYILQAVAASPMNQWGSKGHVPGWPDTALEKGVRAAPDFFPDHSDGDSDYAGGVDLLGVGKNRVAGLKQKYGGVKRTVYFAGW